MARKPEQGLEGLGGRKKLSETERAFMELIWQHPEGISSQEIYEHFPQARGTKSTILYNISEKGYVENCQQGLHHIYKAAVSREEYEQAFLQQELNTILRGSSIDRLIAAFCGKSRLTDAQKEKVDALLEELKDADRSVDGE